MSRPGFYFCFCPDSNLLKMHVDRLLESSGQIEWRKKIIWLDEKDQEDNLWKALNLPNMTGSSRALILRKCESLADSFWKDISPALKGFRPSILPFFCFESQWKYGKPGISAQLSKQKFFKFARQKKWIWEFPGLTRNNISRYIDKKCREKGVEPGPGVVEQISLMLSLDSRSVDEELDKLSLLVHPEKTILKDHLGAVSSQLDIDIFSFLQNLQGGKDLTSTWNKIFRDQQRGEQMLFQFLGLLLREARILWYLETGQDKQVKLYPGIKRQKAALAGTLGKAKILLLWELALEAESGVKSGQFSSDHAMENLTSKLLKLFPG
jgi:DNA polymerase III subunit delta